MEYDVSQTLIQWIVALTALIWPRELQNMKAQATPISIILWSLKSVTYFLIFPDWFPVKSRDWEPLLELALLNPLLQHHLN